jgi:hypothetical protein
MRSRSFSRPDRLTPEQADAVLGAIILVIADSEALALDSARDRMQLISRVTKALCALTTGKSAEKLAKGSAE